MDIKLSEKHNLNYCAEIVVIDNLSKHSNADRLQTTNIKGNNIITDLKTKLGDYVVYFPIECSISDIILHNLSLYRDTTKNKDTNKTGLFDNNGRVKAVKLRGEKSEGFILNYDDFLSVFNKTDTDKIPTLNLLFDMVDGQIICKKYVNQTLQMSNTPKSEKFNKKAKLYNIIENQFRFHKDTEKLQNYIYKLKPNEIVQITKKYHGTSGISSKVLADFPKSKLELFIINIVLLLCKWFKLNININKQRYKDIYASRTVIKNDNPLGYYKCNIWQEAHKVLQPYLTEGMTMYYEIIGYLPTGSFIQKNYNYGFIKPLTNESFKFGTHFGIKIYRMTYTNTEGNCCELTSQQIRNFCIKNNLISMLPEELYYGKLGDIYKKKDIPHNSKFGVNFFNKIKKDDTFGMETIDTENTIQTPFEGIVFRFESPNYLDKIVSYKLKCFRFLEFETKQLDSGESDIEEEN